MKKEITGQFVTLGETEYYKIGNFDKTEPFLFTLATSNDIWVYLSSNGCICAGRESNEKSLFPYISDDKMYHTDDTGSKTLLKVIKDGKEFLWQPFINSYIKHYHIERNLYKSTLGDSAVFEEINHDLGLVFSYRWETCEEYGLVRTSGIKNIGSCEITINVMDGILNILPYGVHPTVQANWSCLADGYKKTELTFSGAALFSLTTPIGDFPTPEDMLKANIIWSKADFDMNIYIDQTALDDFSKGVTPEDKNMYLGERGAYIIGFEKALSPNDKAEWIIVSDVEFDHIKAASLMNNIKENKIDLQEALSSSRIHLKSIIAKADGLQCTGDKMSSVHHMSNVTFNNMRGGLFLADYNFEYEDFINFIKTRNKKVFEKHNSFFKEIKNIISITELKQLARDTKNSDIIRLCYEYLPISFSRRHGDPSRPWNKFCIKLKDENQKPITNYEGNWRDIFQNWEAMCLSFPEYIDSIVSKFLNATTADGYNSYRITKEGIDWETISPDDPCASLGYWGDHQIIYFSRLLEWLSKYNTKSLDYLIREGMFTYANIPYEIDYFDNLLNDPEHTIKFITEKDNSLCEKSAQYGTDYKLIVKDGELYHASFAEKLIVPVLSKISNLVIGGGIWMNTQRPEWNDANNAIVGFGLSVVTVCQLKRHLDLCINILEKYRNEKFEITREVADWLSDVTFILKNHENSIENESITPTVRMNVLSELGYAFDKYKKVIYGNGFTGKEIGTYEDILYFLKLCEKYITYTIKVNKRSDGLYHSYNIMNVKEGSIEISHLKPMLEGQVAVLGCDFLSSDEVVELIRSMENSSLYSQREKTYYLYPIIHAKDFMDKNIISGEYLNKSKLLSKLLADNNTTLIQKDCDGNVRFKSNINSAEKLNNALNQLKEYYILSKDEHRLIEECFEDVFRFNEFMGRSQVLYKYEGIGSVYWHQNSKLLVSLQERMLNSEPNTKEALKGLYRITRSGLGFNKEPESWGAFPQDAYSHTPFNGGAKQPGMTGQVKEDIITRFTELGVIVEDAKIKFDLSLIHESEFLKEATSYNFIRIDNQIETISLNVNSLAFTFCQTPIVYEKRGEDGIEIEYLNGDVVKTTENILPSHISKSVFCRENKVRKITVLH